jgi:hypothetical protein
MSGIDTIPVLSQLKSAIEAPFSIKKATQTQDQFVDSLAALPLISQLKSLLELITGNPNTALITQIKFSKQCILVSQLRSLVEASLMNNRKQAVHTLLLSIDFDSRRVSKWSGDHTRSDCMFNRCAFIFIS